MNKKSIIFWVLYAVLLVFLYILSATDLIIKENETKVYSISILVDGISGENFENMKKGMDEAAYEYNVDMRFPSVAENLTLEEKVEIAEDEIETGAKALILGNAQKSEVADKIREKHPEFPVLVLGEKGDISLDNTRISEFLFENIKKNQGRENEICLVAASLEDDDIMGLSKNLTDKFETAGYKVSLAEGEGPKLEKRLDEFDKEETVFVSLDKESSPRLIKYAKDNEINKGKSKIYTVGATSYLLGQLEEGEIAGVVAWNEYDMGYSMIEKLIHLLADGKIISKEEIETFYLTENDARNEKYIKILYPISG